MVIIESKLTHLNWTGLTNKTGKIYKKEFLTWKYKNFYIQYGGVKLMTCITSNKIHK
jgi:hypothetical protein